jgi:toxin ParE1/3/4
MTRKRRLVFSDAAIADILEQAEWYAAQSGEILAARWQRAVTSAVSLAVSRPAAGALCHFSSPDLGGLRRTRISGFPKHILFYQFDDGEVFVVRVVHGARDLEKLFSYNNH